MDLLATAKPWTYWISFVLVVATILTILALVVGYIVRVVSVRYPKQ